MLWGACANAEQPITSSNPRETCFSTQIFLILKFDIGSPQDVAGGKNDHEGMVS